MLNLLFVTGLLFGAILFAVATPVMIYKAVYWAMHGSWIGAMYYVFYAIVFPPLALFCWYYVTMAWEDFRKGGW